MKRKPFLFAISSVLLSLTVLLQVWGYFSNDVNSISILSQEGIEDNTMNRKEEVLKKQWHDNKDDEVVVEQQGQNSDKSRGGGSSESSTHPIDEYIATTSTDEGSSSSLHNLLKSLKAHSLPESYGDEIITEHDIEVETQRCARYGYEYKHNSSTVTKRRRRIFMGSLIADDTWHIIATHAAETYGLYHTVALIESDTTQTMTKREPRFQEGSLNYRMLQSGIFGPKTDVYVDFHVDAARDYPNMRYIMRENIQREHITKRWKAAGMRPDDIGIICDVDEMFTRDFLLALQSCDVPQFRPGQDCFRPQVTGQALVFEGTPECQFGKRGLSGFFKHPNAVIGECVDRIGDVGVHAPILRYYPKDDNTHLLGTRNFGKQPDGTIYPLWKPWDFRNSPVGENLALEDRRLHTAYHFHNFYDSFDVYRNKYKTYGHPIEYADSVPLAQLNKCTEDMLKCLKGVRGKYRSFEEIEGRRPILFGDDSYRDARQKEMIKGLEADEKIFGINEFLSQ